MGKRGQQTLWVNSVCYNPCLLWRGSTAPPLPFLRSSMVKRVDCGGRLETPCALPSAQVMHDCRNDSAALFFQFGVKLQNVFDTQVSPSACSNPGWPRRCTREAAEGRLGAFLGAQRRHGTVGNRVGGYWGVNSGIQSTLWVRVEMEREDLETVFWHFPLEAMYVPSTISAVQLFVSQTSLQFKLSMSVHLITLGLKCLVQECADAAVGKSNSAFGNRVSTVRVFK